MKKLSKMLAVSTMAIAALVACGTEETTNENPNSDVSSESLFIGMMTDAGTIDDKSFNQGTYEGLLAAQDAFGVTVEYKQPAGEATQDYVNANDLLILAGADMIVSPGFKFTEAIGILQAANPDVKYVILDAEPLVGQDADGNDIYEVADNTLAIFFAEEQSGFLAGVAAALESQTGKVGYIGGMNMPPIQRFGAGFVAGVAYANQTYGTSVEVTDFVYEGSYTNAQNGGIIAGGMYDKGIDIIFVAAGSVGNGVISEAKTRGEAGEEVFVIGVDVDQYEEGLMSNGESIILTSAMKKIDSAAYSAVESFYNGQFPGGQTLIYDATNDSIGLPAENPNLSSETQATTDEVFELIKSGELVIPNDAQTLSDFLTETGYVNGDIVNSIYGE